MEVPTFVYLVGFEMSLFCFISPWSAKFKMKVIWGLPSRAPGRGLSWPLITTAAAGGNNQVII